MKNTFLALITTIITVTIIASCGSPSSNGTSADVIICLSENAYAYHDHKCMGLGQCDSNTEEISITKAKGMGRKACGFCY